MNPQARLMGLDSNSNATFRGDLLTLARQSRGLTQSELAKLSGISQPTISRLEEHALPSAQQLDRLSAALDYPQTFFEQNDPIYGFGVGELFHRRRKTIPAKVLDSVHAEINVRRMTVTRLLKAIDLPEVALPILDRDAPPMSPEDAARALRTRWLLPPGPVRSVTDTLERSGILVVPGRFETQQVDAIGLWPLQSPPMIFVNGKIPQDRLRLTLVHEVAHFVLHAGWGLDLGPEIEDEANRFAAEFLAPAKEIAPRLHDLSLAKLAHLKRHWRISMGALLVRAKELECISDRRYQTLWTEMGRLGYRKREPREFDVVGEQPGATFTEIVRIHLEELEYSVEEIASIIHLYPHRFREEYLGIPSRPRLLPAN